MSKHKINKKESVTYQLVHRSQQDPLIADENAPQRVLLPLKYESKSNSHLPKQELSNLTEKNDDTSTEESFIQPDISSKKVVKFKLNLPPVVFPSEVEEEIGMLRKAAPISGPQLHLDPDVVAALDEDFDYSDPENQLEDNFMELANGEALAGECDEDIFSGSDQDNSYEDDDDQWDDELDKEETKSRFTNYSITSSAIRRNDKLRLLDEKFEKMFIAYEDNEIGALDLEEIEGEVSSNILLDSALAEFNKTIDNLEDGKLTSNQNMASIEEQSDGEEDEDKLVAIQNLKRKWDCESILSSYSNIYNHPKKIIEPKEGKIPINKKTGIPKDAFDKNGLTSKTLGKLNQQNEELKSIPDFASQLSVLSQRSKHETPEDRKIRKQKLRDYRKERRIEKKINSQAFKDESKKQIKIAINNRNNIQGNKLL